MCEKVHLDSNLHRLYRTDWQEEAIAPFEHEGMVVKQSGIKHYDLLAVRDLESPVQSEYEKFAVYLTTTGMPDDAKYIADSTIKKDSTLGDLKAMLLAIPDLNVNKETVHYSFSGSTCLGYKSSACA
jgi:hypothetical protein